MYASMSSLERCDPGERVISGPSYVEGEMKVSFFEVREREPQLIAGPVDIGLYRTEWQVENVGDFFVRAALNVPEQNAGAVLRSEGSNGSFDGTAQLFGFDRVEWCL